MRMKRKYLLTFVCSAVLALGNVAMAAYAMSPSARAAIVPNGNDNGPAPGDTLTVPADGVADDAAEQDNELGLPETGGEGEDAAVTPGDDTAAETQAEPAAAGSEETLAVGDEEVPLAALAADQPNSSPVGKMVAVAGGIAAVGLAGTGIAIATGVIGTGAGVAGAAGAAGAGGANAAGSGLVSKLVRFLKHLGRK